MRARRFIIRPTFARNGAWPTPQQMTDGSFNPGNNPQLITIATNALPCDREIRLATRNALSNPQVLPRHFARSHQAAWKTGESRPRPFSRKAGTQTRAAWHAEI